LRELDDVAVMLLGEGLQYEGVDVASEIEDGGCDAEPYEQ
jgi:hypothetical protein